MAFSDYIGFVIPDNVIYIDINSNILNMKPTLKIGQEIIIFYEFVDGDYNVTKIQLK